MLIIVGKLVWCCLTMATKIFRSKWEIASPSSYWNGSDTPPVEEVSGLGETVRGTGGFGSTGIESGNDTGNRGKCTM